MGSKKKTNEEPIIKENISIEPLEEVMGSRYSIYAKDVIQDRAIPDVRDGLKPVQRRIIFSMYKSGNTFNKPTKKCAHTVGAVMGTYHPHGDSSIYEALARMSQDWKLRYPLIDFQGNNGSIDGDAPAAYRYTESRLSELSNLLVRDIEKQTVEMQLNFDDTEFEPTVLPARFPNLLVNGSEGIAVALATEIPPHNLREVIDAIIYRINHRKQATIQDLMQFVQGPDFPGGGFIYRSQGLQSIYETGKGRIEVASKCEIVANKDCKQIIITEIPYKVVKSQLVYEIDKIRHSKAIDGIIEVRDESDWQGIRIVVDVKKEAKADLILQYLMNKTTLSGNYSANMVAIVNGRPKTLNLLDFIDSYLEHQVDVITRRSKFDLKKDSDRLHIVEGLILASLNINEVVDIIKKSKDKADSKVNLIARFNLSNEQAEAIVTMPLYKLSHTDEIVLQQEKSSLEAEITELKGILEDPKKLDRVLIKDFKEISSKYGDDRKTQIVEKGETKEIDKRQLIAKEDVVVSITYDGYVKRSSIKSFKSSDSLPGIKDGDMFIGYAIANTIDFVICFTNQGNYVTIPVHKITENKWKDEGTHLNDFSTLAPGEKIIKAYICNRIRDDLLFGFISKFGQIKRMSMSSMDLLKHSHPVKCMKLLNNDEVNDVAVLTGNSSLLVITNNGNASLFNENELTIVGNKAGGVKSISGLGKNQAIALLAFAPEERSRVILLTDKGHERVVDYTKLNCGARLAKPTAVCPSFKNDIHEVIGAYKYTKGIESAKLNVYFSDRSSSILEIDDLRLPDTMYAKKNISMPPRSTLVFATTMLLDNLNDGIETYAPLVKEKVETESSKPINQPVVNETSEKSKEEKKKEESNFEQISIFDDLDDM